MLLDGLQRLRVCPPQSIHECFVAPGASPIDGSDDGLGETRGGPGQCRPSLGSTRPGRLSLSNNQALGSMPAHGRVVRTELINLATSTTDAILS